MICGFRYTDIKFVPNIILEIILLGIELYHVILQYQECHLSTDLGSIDLCSDFPCMLVYDFTLALVVLRQGLGALSSGL